MILKIYIDQVLQPIAIHFYEKYLKKIKKIIYIDNGTLYLMSKYTKKFYTEIKLLFITWLIQLLDLNSIKNFYCIIKIQISSYCHQIFSVKGIKVAINKEWKKLTEDNYRKCIKSM